MEEKIVYFEKPGIENTEMTLRLAAERAKARGVKKIILASTRGDTARLAARLWTDTGIKIVVVPHQYNFMASGQRFPAELVQELEKQGHAVHFGTMLFHTENLYGMDTPRIMANLLRTFCQGMKVCVEIILMATDSGHLEAGEEVIAVTGTGRGADTAVVAISAPSTRLSELHITEIICKPFQTKQGPPPKMPPPPPPEKKK
ncbi:MAG TPA: hypothetical protein G4O16_05660 [Dehalococcoidia bacterium]|nr:hypothetical protein [Dehalococcoidia bacterium]